MKTTSILLLLLLVACAQENDAPPRRQRNSTVTNWATGNDPLLEYKGSASYVEGGGYQVAVYPSAVAHIDNGYSLSLTGAGLRQKTVLVATVDVYVVASYVGSSAHPTSGRELSQSPTKALVMSLVRDVTGPQITDAFKEALRANNINPSSPGIQGVLGSMQQNVSAGTQIEIVSITDASGFDHLFIRYEGKEDQYKEKNLGFSLWQAFFGRPVDDQLARLQQELI